jgi:hypothetical protein
VVIAAHRRGHEDERVRRAAREAEGVSGGAESSSRITAAPCAFVIAAPEAFERFTKKDSAASTAES